MSRVSIHYDDGTKTDFDDLGDAIFHAHVQGVAGVAEVSDDDGGRVLTRKQLEDKVAAVRDAPGGLEDQAKAAAQAAKEN